ncbi:MFS transporter [Commensalibacter nepenthis]|uniref:MFS transporter n=1 Tax=Commensalibacter nepenthis TaxID=3043872 RepID=A0ABT6Q575_9PROT|nr:MFS transporter [Commensalibacter sp. TBRC 10068]MDI2112043.1 MFS transporter [Commensalibacter sp. TBRC 10068]
MNSAVLPDVLPISRKILTLIGTIIIQLALGSAYTWSLFNSSIAHHLHVDVYKVAITFGLFCLSLSLASSQAAYLQRKFGVRYTTMIAAMLMFAGLFLASQSTNLLGIYVGAGIIMGAAEGAVYLMIITNCVKMFPQIKGVIASLSIGAYGLGGVIFKYVNHHLLTSYGLEYAFFLWGIIVFVLMIVPAFVMVNAPEQIQNAANSLRKVVIYKSYWGFWAIFLMTSMTGIYIIGAAKDIGEQIAHLDANMAANAVAVLTFFNLCGRLVIGSASDKIGTLLSLRICQILLCIGVATICYLALNTLFFFIAVACIAFAFGGTIAVYPPLIGDFFGIAGVTKNYGFIYLGFGFGSVLGNVISFVCNGFERTIPVLLVSMVLAVIIVMFTKNRAYFTE